MQPRVGNCVCLMQVDRLKGLQQEAEKRSAALKAECNRMKEDLRVQDEDLKSLRKAVAHQVDEMVRLPLLERHRSIL